MTDAQAALARLTVIRDNFTKGGIVVGVEEVHAILAHVEAQAAEVERLRKFVGRVLDDARQYMSDIDGGDVQAWAVECGLLEAWTASEPCGEQCECAEVADFPTRCYRLTETGKAAIHAPKEQR